jgi:hypothetical protein
MTGRPRPADSSPTAYLIQRAGYVEILARYIPQCIAALKDLIQARCRAWDPGARTWRVNNCCAPRAAEILSWWFELEVLVEDGAHDSRTCLHHVADEWPAHAALHLLPDAPPELVDAAYRALAKVHHPDHGGRHEDMVVINQAYEKLTAGAA